MVTIYLIGVVLATTLAFIYARFWSPKYYSTDDKAGVTFVALICVLGWPIAILIAICIVPFYLFCRVFYALLEK